MSVQREFDFVVKLGGVSEMTDDLVNALFEAGCDDALVSQRDGQVFVTLAREGENFSDAWNSAVCDIEKAVPEAKPILVGMI